MNKSESFGENRIDSKILSKIEHRYKVPAEMYEAALANGISSKE